MSPSQVPTTSEPVQSSPCSHPIYWTSILMLSSHLLLGLTSGLFPSGIPTKTLRVSLLFPYVYLSCSLTCYMPRQSPSWFDDKNSIWWGVQIIYAVGCIIEVMKCVSIAGQGPLRSNILSIYTHRLIRHGRSRRYGCTFSVAVFRTVDSISLGFC